MPRTRSIRALNQILDTHDFDGYFERLCQRFYADDGRPGLPPGRYFRLSLIGYFEGLDAERAIAWRAAAPGTRGQGFLDEHQGAVVDVFHRACQRARMPARSTSCPRR